MRPRLSPEDQDLGSSATLYCYREQSGGGGGSTEVLPSADVPEGEKPLKAKAKARKVGQLNLREEDVVMETVNELKTDVRLPDGFTRGNKRRNAQFYCFFGRFKTLNTLATFFPIRLFVGSRRLQTFSEKAFILITLTSVAAFVHTFEMA